MIPKIEIERLLEEERRVILSETNSDLLTYREFISYFKNIEIITLHNLIIGSNFVYGWMPTMLTIYGNNDDINLALHDINRAKQGTKLTKQEIGNIVKVINHSLVGTSKLLHFISPNNYAIWDSRVCKYLSKGSTNIQIDNIENYLEYLRTIEGLITSPKFHTLHESINEKCGYLVSGYRAIELVMYWNGN